MENERIFEKLQDLTQGLDISSIKEFMYDDYENLIALRNTLNEGNIEEELKNQNVVIYDEDIVMLDHILDYLEIFYREIGINRYSVVVENFENDTKKELRFNDLSEALKFYQIESHKAFTKATLYDLIDDENIEIISYCNENPKDIGFYED